PMETGGHHVLAKATAMPRPVPAPQEFCGADFVPENRARVATLDEGKLAKASKVENPGLLQADVMLDVANSLYVNVFGSSSTTATKHVNSLVGARPGDYDGA